MNAAALFSFGCLPPQADAQTILGILCAAVRASVVAYRDSTRGAAANVLLRFVSICLLIGINVKARGIYSQYKPSVINYDSKD